METHAQKLADKVKASLGDIDYEGDLEATTTTATTTATEGEGTTDVSQYYKTIPYWRSQPHVRPLPSEEVAKIWAAKDNKHRMGFLEQQAAKQFALLLPFPFFPQRRSDNRVKGNYGVLNRRKSEKLTTEKSDADTKIHHADDGQKAEGNEEVKDEEPDQERAGKRKLECVEGNADCF